MFPWDNKILVKADQYGGQAKKNIKIEGSENQFPIFENATITEPITPIASNILPTI
jgi:hypothetical protein